jgi:hypothetical protein
MSKSASASALAAIALSCAFAVSPAASATASQSARPKTHVQPGGPITLADRHAPFSRDLGATQNVVSNNWGGYASERLGTRFRYIHATFFVPYVNCAASPNSFSGHWVGLDGLSDTTVEQDGILAACRGTTPQYSAWYEMFPQSPVYKSISIQPGDSIEASVYYQAGAHTFKLALTDTTNGGHFSVTKTCPVGSRCRRTSAEVISEAPSSNGSVLPLTDFSAESYSSVTVTDRAGQRSALRAPNWDTLSIRTENSGGDVLDQPTQISRGTAFDMYWMRTS